MAAALGAISGGGSSLLDSLVPIAAAASGFKGKAYSATGTMPFIKWARSQGLVTAGTVAALVPELPGLFGGYPFPQKKGTEIGPDALFIALFFILGVSNLGVWAFNLRRGHSFFISVGIAFFCFMKVVGFACRIAWAQDVTRIPIAICAVVFTQVAQLVLLTMNMILAHRVFTWRHPETGNSLVVNLFIDFIYFFVLGIIVMAIVGQSLPYIRFQTEYIYHICRNVTKAAAILNLVYSAIPVVFLGVAFSLPPGWIMKNPFKKGTTHPLPPVFQASWIRSAGIFYYPPKGSQRYVFRGEEAAKAVRIIPSREPPGNGEHEPHYAPMHPESPRMSHAVIIATISSVVLMFNTCFRVAAVFRGDAYGQTRPDGSINISFWPWHPYVLFVFYGAMEVLMITMYLVTRVDLRFYIPEMPMRRGRSTAGAAAHVRLGPDSNPIAYDGGSQYSGKGRDTPPSDELDVEKSSGQF